jgi:hypothetical protein
VKLGGGTIIVLHGEPRPVKQKINRTSLLQALGSGETEQPENSRRLGHFVARIPPAGRNVELPAIHGDGEAIASRNVGLFPDDLSVSKSNAPTR